jgi:quinol monooxygenase YgiN
MTIEYIRYVLTSSTAANFITAYGKAGHYLEAAPECIGYELAQRDDDPNTFVLRIAWQSAEAHMSGFRKGPNFPPLLALIRPFIGEIAEMEHYSVVAFAQN